MLFITANLKKPILVCNEEHRFIVAEQMRELNIEEFIILLEPFGRNTAPAKDRAGCGNKHLESEAPEIERRRHFRE